MGDGIAAALYFCKEPRTHGADAMANLHELRDALDTFAWRIVKLLLVIVLTLFYLSIGLAICSVNLPGLRLTAMQRLLGFIFVFILSPALALWTVGLIQAVLWHIRLKKLQRADQLAKLQPNSKPYPPAKRGLCDSCSQYADTVYYISSGRRLCNECYRQFQED